MALDRELSATAYLVNESRRRGGEVGRDHLAEHWIPPALRPAVRSLWDDFAAAVYPHDDLELALRNRFFLDRLETMQERGETVFVNVAAGFTSYPFLTRRPCASVEVDLPGVIAAKRRRRAELERDGVLPERPLTFHAADLTADEDRGRLGRLLVDFAGGRRSVILFEGISYYLPGAVFEELAGLAAEAQAPGSRLLFDYWSPLSERSPVFRRLSSFFAERFGIDPESYHLFDRRWIEALPGYRIVETTGVAEQEAVYCGTAVLADPDAVLPELYAVLERV
jgi:O-methyltransferase involved in polyketide biosynthesis